MTEYKYLAHDDAGYIKDRVFDNFADAYDYVQDGLKTFIEEIPFVDGVEQEEDEQIIWTWDDVNDRDTAISRALARHPEVQAIKDELAANEDEYTISRSDLGLDPLDSETVGYEDGYKEEVLPEDLEVVVAGEPEEVVSFAKCILGDDCDFFDQDFDAPVRVDTVEVSPAEFEKYEDEARYNIENDVEIPENPFNFDFEIIEPTDDKVSCEKCDKEVSCPDCVDKSEDKHDEEDTDNEDEDVEEDLIATEAPKEWEECDPHKVGPVAEDLDEDDD